MSKEPKEMLLHLKGTATPLQTGAQTACTINHRPMKCCEGLGGLILDGSCALSDLALGDGR